MNNLRIEIKRDKSFIEIYSKGNFICKIMVSDHNRGNSASILLVGDKKTAQYKLIKEEKNYNKEEYNE